MSRTKYKPSLQRRDPSELADGAPSQSEHSSSCGVAYGVFEGIYSRVEAKTELRQVAANSAIPSVNVVYPKGGAEAEDIELPGNTQAFTDTPIYARTNGYVKEWYVDIGARVKQGQLLAVIETPELDQQLRQAKADLKNAEANLQIADITATRWQNLLKTDSVSHQEADQAVSNFHSKQALVDSNKANVERLEQLQSFERIVAPVDGVITARNTDIGALIQADTTAPKELFPSFCDPEAAHLRSGPRSLRPLREDRRQGRCDPRRLPRTEVFGNARAQRERDRLHVANAECRSRRRQFIRTTDAGSLRFCAFQGSSYAWSRRYTVERSAIPH